MKTKSKLFALGLAVSLFMGNIPVQAAEQNNHVHEIAEITSNSDISHEQELAISNSKITINLGDSYNLDLLGTDKIPRWTSWNVNQVRIDQDGIVTGIRTGTTIVTARVGLNIKKCTVNVVAPSIKINKKSGTIYTGGTSTSTLQLKATVKGASKNVIWESSNPEVAVVDANGKVTSVAPGETTITATANGKRAVCNITVKETSISLNLDNMRLSTKGAGSSMKVVPTVVGSKKNVKWTTSDKKVAVVKGGKVTGKNTGTATITATVNGISTTCTVVVNKGNISISEEKVLLYAGETKQLKTNAGKKDIVAWTSSNSDVVSVDEKGKLSAVNAGTAVITVSSNDTTDTCEVIVKDTVTNIKEDDVILRTKGNEKFCTLTSEIVGRKSSVKWVSSDKKIATVSKGKVTAKKSGTVTITAIANGMEDTVNVTVLNYEPTIKLNHQEYILFTNKGNSVNLKATVDGPLKKATFQSTNPEIVTVNAKGKVTAVGEGQATIIAKANGVSAECNITVIESKVMLGANNIVLDKGEKAELSVDVIGNSQSVTYKIMNPKIAAIKNGVITAKQYGETDIKVIANGITDICHIKVVNKDHETEDENENGTGNGTENETENETLDKSSYKECIGKTLKEYMDEKSATLVEPSAFGFLYYVDASGRTYKTVSGDVIAHGNDYIGEWKDIDLEKTIMLPYKSDCITLDIKGTLVRVRIVNETGKPVSYNNAKIIGYYLKYSEDMLDTLRESENYVEYGRNGFVYDGRLVEFIEPYGEYKAYYCGLPYDIGVLTDYVDDTVVDINSFYYRSKISLGYIDPRQSKMPVLPNTFMFGDKVITTDVNKNQKEGCIFKAYIYSDNKEDYAMEIVIQEAEDPSRHLASGEGLNQLGKDFEKYMLSEDRYWKDERNSSTDYTVITTNNLSKVGEWLTIYVKDNDSNLVYSYFFLEQAVEDYEAAVKWSIQMIEAFKKLVQVSEADEYEDTVKNNTVSSNNGIDENILAEKDEQFSECSDNFTEDEIAIFEIFEDLEEKTISKNNLKNNYSLSGNDLTKK